MAYHIFFQNAQKLKDNIELRQDAIINLLGKYEPYETAQHEIDRSISTLAGVREEFTHVEIDVHDLVIATFFPLNLPLYSLVLFAVIPSAFAAEVFVRASGIMQPIINELAAIISLNEIFPEVKVKNINRSVFLTVYTRPANVIIFTGRYENAVLICKEFPRALVIFNGGGVNPAIVFDNADSALAANKILEMRTFNSGQDCAGTDAIFVHQDRLSQFLAHLNARLDTLTVGNYGDVATQVGPVLRKQYLDRLEAFLEQENASIIRHGEVDREKALVRPYIICKPISQHTGLFHEFFAPVFYLLTFEHVQELGNVLLSSNVQDYTMYVSYFGDNPIINRLTKAQLLHNCIVNDVEQGNIHYGGYGEKANFVSFGNTIVARPILISREINDFYLTNGLTLAASTTARLQEY